MLTLLRVRPEAPVCCHLLISIRQKLDRGPFYFLVQRLSFWCFWTLLNGLADCLPALKLLSLFIIIVIYIQGRLALTFLGSSSTFGLSTCQGDHSRMGHSPQDCMCFQLRSASKLQFSQHLLWKSDEVGICFELAPWTVAAPERSNFGLSVFHARASSGTQPAHAFLPEEDTRWRRCMSTNIVRNYQGRQTSVMITTNYRKIGLDLLHPRSDQICRHRIWRSSRATSRTS